MKKLIFCFVLSMFAFVANAQKHLSFMGIPLNGSVTSFQQKLAAKKVWPDKELNALLSVGMRAFNGPFSGYDSKICVYYNEKSKNVYRAKATITYTDENITLDRYDEFKKLLCEKYKTGRFLEGTKDGYYTYTIIVPDEKDPENIIGEIDLYISKFELTPIEYQYILHIDYVDWANRDKNKEEKLSDL